MFMNDIITPNQMGFIRQRNINDNIVVAQELLHIMHKLKGRKHFFVLKVDLPKAYDGIS